MFTIKKILVPTDFSSRSAAAYTHAQEIAHRFNARVDFMHIIPTLRYFNESLSKLTLPLDMEKDVYPHAQEESEQRLKNEMREYLSDGVTGEAVVKIGRKPAEEIVDHASSGDYDLIVMSSRGEHESDLLRGGVTEKVIRQSEVPVFTVDQKLSPEGLRRILVPTDGSQLSFTSFPLALTLATVYDAEIILLHVLELHGSRLEGGTSDRSKSESENVYEQLRTALEDYLTHYRSGNIKISRGEESFSDQLVVGEDLSNKTIPLRTVIERGVTAHAVIESYATDHADAVVITTHGHSGLARFFLGSTTEKVAQYVDLPVLTVRPSMKKMKTEA